MFDLISVEYSIDEFKFRLRYFLDLESKIGSHEILSVEGSPVSIDVFHNEDLLGNADVMGRLIRRNIETEPVVKQVRQHGLMIAIEFSFSDQPDRVMKVVELLRHENVLVLLCGHRSQYVRLLPPLNVSLSDVDTFLEKFHKVIGCV